MIVDFAVEDGCDVAIAAERWLRAVSHIDDRQAPNSQNDLVLDVQVAGVGTAVANLLEHAQTKRFAVLWLESYAADNSAHVRFPLVPRASIAARLTPS